MSQYSGCHTSIVCVIVVCFLIQCAIISKNNMVCADSTTPLHITVKHDITKTTDIKATKPEAQKGQSTDSQKVEIKTKSAEKGTPNGNGVIVFTNKTVTPTPLSDNSSLAEPKGIPLKSISAGAVVRGFYVFVGLGAIVVMYIVVRTIRLKRKKTTVRKYGILANREDVEMTPLGAEDDEEDMTLFDMTSHKSRP